MYKTLKIPFKHILKKEDIICTIEDMILRTTTIIKHIYYFIKLYTIYSFENGFYDISFNKDNIRYIFTLITSVKSNTNIQYEYSRIKDFYNNVYSKLNIDKISRYGLTNVLAYETDIIITCIENNIKNNFQRHFNRYINTILDTKKKLSLMKDQEEKKNYLNVIKKIKIDILSFDKYTSDKEHHNFIQEQQKYLFNKYYDNNNKIDEDKNNKNNILYDVKKSPQKYLYTFYRILEKYEKINLETNDKSKHIKLFSMLPLRTSLIPKHITLDSEILIQNFKDKIKNNIDKFPEKINNIEKLRRKFTECQDTLWNLMFKTNIKINKNYTFDYLIKTDGYSCSLQYRLCNNEKKSRFTKGKSNKDDKEKNKKTKSYKNSSYIDDILKENRFALNDKKIACIDPNKGDLIYSGIYNNNEFKSFRYTNNQRKKEMKTKKYSKICREIENKKKINDKSVSKLTSKKTEYKKNINTSKGLREYIDNMEKLDKMLEEHYRSSIYRKLNINRYINTQRSESKLIKNFKEKIGSNKDTIIVIGDNGTKDVIIKGLESTISKRIVDIFVKNKYETYLIDEFRTSKLCNGCEKELSRFKEVKSKRPKTEGKIKESYGLLRCQSSAGCNVIHNRDKNSVKNMLKIVENYKLTGKRLLNYKK